MQSVRQFMISSPGRFCMLAEFEHVSCGLAGIQMLNFSVICATDSMVDNFGWVFVDFCGILYAFRRFAIFESFPKPVQKQISLTTYNITVTMYTRACQGTWTCQSCIYTKTADFPKDMCAFELAWHFTRYRMVAPCHWQVVELRR